VYQGLLSVAMLTGDFVIAGNVRRRCRGITDCIVYFSLKDRVAPDIYVCACGRIALDVNL
jgi:hypothetical protein